MSATIVAQNVMECVKEYANTHTVMSGLNDKSDMINYLPKTYVSGNTAPVICAPRHPYLPARFPYVPLHPLNQNKPPRLSISKLVNFDGEEDGTEAEDEAGMGAGTDEDGDGEDDGTGAEDEAGMGFLTSPCTR